MKKLDKKFFERDTLFVVKDLLGKYLVRELKVKRKKKKVFVGKIVETEAYIGEDDLACHASKGRTNRTEMMYGEAGHAYVYMIYGMYHCLNIVTEKEGFPAAVLIRAIEPILDDVPVQDLKKMGSGPGKLCRWMEIDRGLNGADVTKSEELYITDKLPPNCHSRESGNPENTVNEVGPRIPPTQTATERTGKSEDDKGENLDIVEAKRVGIDYAKYCADHPWRFYIKDNSFISKK
ncbi:DNA-3-methyladenine glycosylase [bacterium (Candidatus Howlettbacteria) CG_4_10_14_0_8_um_filter_40_9]|nr:MAG: DNA-3-methyladenine glycosylase [bacterium (Candidatus Howlettbacteria) CG_4_10_14_0_8_um_filter_40_9]